MAYVFRTLPPPLRYESDWFAKFVNRVLLCFEMIITHDYWFAHDYYMAPFLLFFEIPRCLFMCNTLVSLKLFLQKNINSVTPPSHCFPCLKLLHVTLWFPYPHTVEKLFSSFPVLEDLIIDGEDSDALAFNLVISAPKFGTSQDITKKGTPVCQSITQVLYGVSLMYKTYFLHCRFTLR